MTVHRLAHDVGQYRTGEADQCADDNQQIVAQREIIVVDHLAAGHRLAEAQPGKHLGHLLDDGIVVGLDGQVVGSELDRSVGVTRDQPEREQLHHLAGVILVRVVPRGRVLLLVAQVAEIGPHDGMA